MLKEVKLRVMYRAIKTRMQQENKTFEAILNTYTKLSDKERLDLLTEYSNEK